MKQMKKEREFDKLGLRERENMADRERERERVWQAQSLAGFTQIERERGGVRPRVKELYRENLAN